MVLECDFVVFMLPFKSPISNKPDLFFTNPIDQAFQHDKSLNKCSKRKHIAPIMRFVKINQNNITFSDREIMIIRLRSMA